MTTYISNKAILRDGTYIKLKQCYHQIISRLCPTSNKIIVSISNSNEYYDFRVDIVKCVL